MIRAAFFTLVGAAFCVYWVVADPGYEASATQNEWNYVLAFSAVILLLAAAVPLFAQLAGGRRVHRLSFVAAAGATISSVANIFEDGLRIDRVFFLFVLGSAIMLIGLLVLAVAIAVPARGSHRALALVPLGTLAAIILFVPAGGALMLATWLGAAAVALVLPRPMAARPAPATH